MLFSIIVPVYKAEKYFPSCLRSIEDQLCQDFEVVLVDDGSTDGSGLMCDEFAAKYPGRVTVIHKGNGGCLSARRAGIAVAKGEYSLNIDADDLLDAYCLDLLRTKLAQYEKLDMIIFRMLLLRDGKLLPDMWHPDMGKDILCEGKTKRLLYEGVIKGTMINSLAIKLIKTSILQSDPTVYPANHGAEDLLQSLYPLTQAKRVLYTNEPLYYYRMTPQSVTNSYGLETLSRKNNLCVYKSILGYLPLWDMDTQVHRDGLHALWLHSTVSEMRKGFAAATSEEQKMALLRFSWRDFVDGERPIPQCLNSTIVSTNANA